MTALTKKSGYMPSLDGWRALAIIGVLMAHDLSWNVGRFSNKNFQFVGGDGVYLFFAISGFLICTRILQEESALGHFNIKSFYVRRLFRIQPASMVYLAIVLLLMLCGICHEYWRFWLGATFFYANFVSHVGDVSNGSFTGHFWTLSAEEHFYILLSLLLFFFRRHRIKIFAGIIFTTWILQNIARKHNFYFHEPSPRRTYWIILYFLGPSLLALLLRKPKIHAWAIRWLRPWVAYSITAALMLVSRLRHINDWHSILNVHILSDQQSYLFFGFSLWIIATVLHPKSMSTRLLELAPIRFVGRISYSIYLWHIPFFVSALHGNDVTWPPLHFLSGRPWKYIATLCVACLSYYFIEKPLIRTGHRLAPPITPGHRDLQG